MDGRFQIRLGAMTDIESIAALERSIQNAPHWRVADYLAALSPPPGSASTEPPGTHQLGTRRCLFLAESGTQAIGFAVARVTAMESESHAELESVGVADAVRRLGIGRALCAASIEWARGQNAGEMELEVRSRSEEAISLYRSLGFAIEGRRPRYYSEPVDDALLMRLVLASQPL